MDRTHPRSDSQHSRSVEASGCGGPHAACRAASVVRWADRVPGRRVVESATDSGTYELPIVADGSPDQDFDRAWAVHLLSLAMERLKRHYHQRGRAEVFEVLHPTLAGGGREAGAYLQWATQLKMSEGALRTEMSRMKDRWKLTIEEEIAETLPHPTPEAVKEERRALFAALSSN